MNIFICNNCSKKEKIQDYTRKGYNYIKKGTITRPSITYSHIVLYCIEWRCDLAVKTMNNNNNNNDRLTAFDPGQPG